MRGIVLAGGSGTRLHPITRGVSKQLLAVYDKPLIYYPISTLMLAGLRDILVITTPRDQAAYQSVLGDGSQFGIRLSYAQQPSPGGLAQAFLIGEGFIGSDKVALALGDNIFFGQGFPDILRRAVASVKGASVFAYRVRDPEHYGVVEFDPSGKAVGLEEKPKVPRSPWAVTGLYFYENSVIEIAKGLEPSPRGELEITDVNRAYLTAGCLGVERLGRGFAWLDTGTHDALLHAANFIKTVEERQGLKIACLEEIGLRMGYLTPDQIEATAHGLRQTAYGEYLSRVLREDF